MLPLKKVLGTPLIHGVLGFSFFAAFSWPIFSFEEPINTWMFMYGAWAVGIGVLFATTMFGTPPDVDGEDEEDEAEGQHV